VLELVTAAALRSVVEASLGPGRCGRGRCPGVRMTKLYTWVTSASRCPSEGRSRHRGPTRRRKPSRRHSRATHDGRDIAARLSARLDLPVLANVVGMDAREGGLTSEHSIFGARRWCGPSSRRRPGLFIVQAKSFAARPPRRQSSGP